MERRPLGSGSFAAVGTAGADATSFSDGSVSHDTSYEYRVFATNGIGDSAPSNTASVTTPPPAPPNAPENLVATPVDPMRIDLSWSDSSSDETSFRIERRLRHDPLPSGAEAKLNTVNGHYYAFIASNIAPGDAHIQARKLQFFGTPGHMATITSAQENEFIREMSPTPIAWVGGTDRQSTPDWIFVSGPEAGQPMTYFNWAPGEPNNPGVEVYIAMYSDGTWNNVGDAPDWAGGYFVEFDTPPLPGVEFATVASVPSNVTTYSDFTASADTSYEYRVFAVNGAGDSIPTSLASATTPRLPSPNPPSSLVATAVIASEVDLSWTDNSTNETGFRIERRRYHEPLPGGAVPSRNDANGNHYAFIAGPILPLDARAAAAGLVFLGTPGHCVTITSWLEQDFMSTVFVDLGWIGGTDEVVEGTWRWVGGPEDGETFEQAGFSFWAPGEPNNAGGNENYACIGFANLSWNDYSAGQILSGYYVEFETGSITDVDFAPIATVGPDVTSFADKTAVSGVSYEYRVIAIGSLASSDPSNTIAVAVP